MIKVYSKGNAKPQTWKDGTDMPDDALWFDLVKPTDEEVQRVQDATGLALPSRKSIAAFGRSMGDRENTDPLRLHMSLFADDTDEKKALNPLALTLTDKLLVSMRYEQSEAFDAMPDRLDEKKHAQNFDIFILLVETVVEQLANRMQGIANDLSKLADHIFRGQRMRTQALRQAMVDVGELERRLNRIGASLLGFNRMLVFTCDQPIDWLPKKTRHRLDAINKDMTVLDKFNNDLTDKLEFQLDAILGFINTDQNEVMKLLTVVSVATVPPVILAGIWGMNFEHMPALTWAWGYPLALLLIAISIAIPVFWFRRRGWLTDDVNGDGSANDSANDSDE